MKYQNVRNEIIKSKNLIMRCLPASCNSNYNVVENLDTKEKVPKRKNQGCACPATPVSFPSKG